MLQRACPCSTATSPGSFFLHCDKSVIANKLMSASLASIFTSCFFRGGGASSIGSSLSQSSNIVRDTFEHAPECAIAGGSCDNTSSSVIFWGRRDGGHGCNRLSLSSAFHSSSRSTLRNGKSSLGARSNPHPPTGYTSPVHGCEAGPARANGIDLAGVTGVR